MGRSRRSGSARGGTRRSRYTISWSEPGYISRPSAHTAYMRAHVLLAVPFAALLACTGASSARSSTTTTAAGRASTHSSSAASAQRATAPANWYSYHRTDGRSGYSPGQPTPTGPLRVLHNIQLDGAVYASPLVWKGITIVAT